MLILLKLSFVQETSTYCLHYWSFHGYWAYTLLKKCSFKSTKHYIDLPKQYPSVIYQICWRGLSFTMSWKSLLGFHMDWSLCDACLSVMTLMHMMHPCAEIHNAMSELTGSANKTSEQHLELEVARITRDLRKVDSYLQKTFLSQKKPSLFYLSLRLLLFHNILISTVIMPMKLRQKFVPR